MSNKNSRVVVLRSPDIIDSEAADWLSRLDSGELSQDDRRALREWLAQDPQHKLALKDMAAMWHDMDFLLNPVSGSRNEQGENKIGLLASMVALWGIKRPVMVMMSLMCVLGFVLWSSPDHKVTENAFYATAIGKQQLELLSDGSRAHLNTNSVIEVEFTKRLRVVRLMQGEAMFDVVHDPSRPFVVYAGNRVVQAIGTAFVVRLESENIYVAVTDGQVQLSKREESLAQNSTTAVGEQEVVLVSKGEGVKVHDGVSGSAPKPVDTNEFNRRLSWTRGQLVFENERLEQVIKEISRYVPRKIVIEDPELRDIRISGRFALGDTEALLEAMEVSFDIETRHRENEVIYISR